MSVTIALVCFLSLVTCTEFLGHVAADVAGNIKLIPDGVVQVYNGQDNTYYNICWVKDMAENIPNTICKQLGSTKAQDWKKKISFHTEQKKFLVMSCRNDASHILRCLTHLKRCNNDGILAVKCNETEYVYEGQLRLLRKENPRPQIFPRNASLSGGWLQVYLKGEWTFVCAETFDNNNAETACRQLGYTSSYNHTAKSFTSNYNNNNGYSNKLKVWIGVNTKAGRLECEQPEDCLTKCYSMPEHKEFCENSLFVYLECNFEIVNVDADFASAGSPSACSIQEDNSSESEKSVTVGIVLGCISLVFVCAFAVLITLYCCTSGKKLPHDDEPSKDQLDPSYAEDPSLSYKNADIEEEHETTFNDANEYQPPPEVTPLVTRDDSTSDN